ncbi:MAG: hypothetical protein ACRD3E_16445, partial [Terriglobales bacterium]
DKNAEKRFRTHLSPFMKNLRGRSAYAQHAGTMAEYLDHDKHSNRGPFWENDYQFSRGMRQLQLRALRCRGAEPPGEVRKMKEKFGIYQGTPDTNANASFDR